MSDLNDLIAQLPIGSIAQALGITLTTVNSYWRNIGSRAA